MKKFSSLLIAFSVPALLWGSQIPEKDASTFSDRVEVIDQILHGALFHGSQSVRGVQDPVLDQKLSTEYQKVLKELIFQGLELAYYKIMSEDLNKAFNQTIAELNAEREAHKQTKALLQEFFLHTQKLYLQYISLIQHNSSSNNLPPLHWPSDVSMAAEEIIPTSVQQEDRAAFKNEGDPDEIMQEPKKRKLSCLEEKKLIL